MADNEVKIRHDMSSVVRHFAGIIQLIEAGFDFKTVEGKVVLEEAKQAHQMLALQLEKLNTGIKN